MLIVVADRRGLLGGMVKQAFPGQGPGKPVAVHTALCWKDVEESIWGAGKCFVVSGQLISGFNAVDSLASKVKAMNSEAVFIAYNGLQESGKTDLIDAFIPGCKPGETAVHSIGSFLRILIEDSRVGQLRLF